MAPEQARGHVEAVDERADVFALGSMLCEVFTGQPAFTGPNAREIQRKAALGDLADAFARLDACGVDADLVALARDCLAAVRDDRPRDASAFVERLSGYLTSIEQRLRAAELERAAEVARAEEAQARVAVERSRRRRTVALAASLLALSTLGGLTSTYALQQRQERLAAADRVLGEATTLLAQARDRPEELARWQVALAALKRIDGDALPAEARGRLDALRREAQAGEAAARADQDLLAVLLDIRSTGAETPDGTGYSASLPDGSASDAAYAAAFRAAGYDVDPLGPEAAGAGSAHVPRRSPWSWPRRSTTGRPSAVGRGRRTRPPGSGWWPPPASPTPTPAATNCVRSGSGPTARRSSGRCGPWRHRPTSTPGPPRRSTCWLAPSEVRATSRRPWPCSAAPSCGTPGTSRPTTIWPRSCTGKMAQVSPPTRRSATIPPPVPYGPRRAALASALQSRGEIDEAIAIFRDVKRLRPEDGQYCVSLGYALWAGGRADEARAAFEEAVVVCRATVRRNPGSAEAHTGLGSALMDQLSTQGLPLGTLDPDATTTPAARSQALQARGRIDEAIEAHREAIRIGPDNASVQMALGYALRLRGKPDEAAAAYREAARLQPDLGMPHAALGGLLQRQGKTAEALLAYREAIRIRPDWGPYHTALGNFLQRQGKTAEALLAYREAARVEPNHWQYRRSFAAALLVNGELDDAVDEFREALRLKPVEDSLHYSLCLALLWQKKPDEAAAEFREALRLEPRCPLAYGSSTIAQLEQRGPYLNRAIAAYREAIQLRPDLPEPYIILGKALVTQGKLVAAIAAYREAARLRPDHDLAYLRLAATLERQGKHSEAADAYREAIRVRPDDAEAHYLLGRILFSQGQYTEALSELRTGHELGAEQPPWCYSSGEWVRRAEQSIALANRLPAILAGSDRPKDDADRLALARVCYEMKLFAAAARFWGDAVEANPELAEDRQAQHRYNAACAAALAGGGQGQDDPPPDETAKAELRRRAHAWLEGELDTWSAVLRREEMSPPSKAQVSQALRHWKRDPDMAGVRAPDALAALPEPEHAGWHSLWARVDRLLEEATSAP